MSAAPAFLVPAAPPGRVVGRSAVTPRPSGRRAVEAGEAGMPMTREELTAYAAAQVAVADQLLARHRPGTHHCCACGQPMPCSHAETIARRRDHYAQFLDPR
ncbi:hypothetical protein GCM10010124_33390 [Pilimelia terevasa]|uniref:Uncharacterized protein n=1 Tax=Pilimelia terevasa TaxID=53372 RepID=A0A8J3BPU8_9ACTN|nr:hypothetical protein [Pilimelia terevasa]GGK37894.1 hypothetical protein GCM10010124_33390 [Pilimelia terevasa]